MPVPLLFLIQMMKKLGQIDIQESHKNNDKVRFNPPRKVTPNSICDKYVEPSTNNKGNSTYTFRLR